MKYVCKVCGTEFEAKASAKRQFCSLPCAIKGKRTRVGKSCPHGVLGKKHCTICQRQYFREYGRKWRAQNSERLKKRLLNWQRANRDKVRQYSRNHYERHREKEIIRCSKGNVKRYHKYRLAALTHYGGEPPKCFCCGEKYIEFLCIDHIAGNGATHRKEMKAKYAWGIYEFLKRNDYPEGYRVLCHNCNASIGYYGYCPHE